MFKKSFIVLCLLLFCSIISFAQNVNRQNETQWEYLIVYNSSEFNELGKKGWELVGVSSDGYFFKRPLDEERTKHEANLQYNKYLEDEKAKEEKVKFTDLDAVAYFEDKKAQEDIAKEKLKQLLKSFKGYEIISSEINANFPRTDNRFLKAKIVIDATKSLLIDGYKYRSSEVSKYVQNAKNDVLKLFPVKPENFGRKVDFYNTDSIPTYGNGIFIQITVVGKFKDTSQTFANGYTKINWDQLENF